MIHPKDSGLDHTPETADAKFSKGLRTEMGRAAR
jgi:hypothetical protein